MSLLNKLKLPRSKFWSQAAPVLLLAIFCHRLEYAVGECNKNREIFSELTKLCEPLEDAQCQQLLNLNIELISVRQILAAGNETVNRNDFAKKIKLKDAFKDAKIILLVFSATWCHYCTPALAALNMVTKKIGTNSDLRTAIIDISEDSFENIKAKYGSFENIANVYTVSTSAINGLCSAVPAFIILDIANERAYKTNFNQKFADALDQSIFSVESNHQLAAAGFFTRSAILSKMIASEPLPATLHPVMNGSNST